MLVWVVYNRQATLGRNSLLGGYSERTKVYSAELIMEWHTECEEIVQGEVLKAFKM